MTAATTLADERRHVMRRLVVTEFLTLDGVMQGPGDRGEDTSGGFRSGGWQMPYNDETMMTVASEGMAINGGYLFGRRTYEIFSAYWPKQPDSEPFAASLNHQPKAIVSRTLREPLEWENSTLIRDDVPGAIRALKEDGGGEAITVLGSGELVQSLIEHDLVDEFLLMIHPLSLGEGKRLFRDSTSPVRLRLVESRTTGTGVLIARYQPERADRGLVGAGAGIAAADGSGRS
jgi:dihydrofolate reductase